MARQRRSEQPGGISLLETFPKWLWDVLDAAKAGQSYTRAFPAKNFAVNARHRYHYFRKAAIREKVPGADILTEMPCSMLDDTTLHWMFIGDLADYTAEPMREPAAALPLKGQQPIRQLGDQSESEKLVEKWYGPGRKSEPAAAAQPEPSADLDIPAFDLSTGNEPPPPCPPHELDELTDGCAKCRLPRSQW